MMPGYWPGPSGQATKLGICPYLVVTTTSCSIMEGSVGQGSGREPRPKPAPLSRAFPVRSAAVKDRRALLAPRLERLGMVLGLGAAGAHRFQRAAVEPAAGGLVDCPLQPGKRQRRIPCNDRGEGIDPLAQLRRRDRLVEIADVQEFRRLDRLRGHEHFLRRGDAEPADI